MQFMDEAIRQAYIARDTDEVPVGAVVVKDGKIIAQEHNRIKNSYNPVGHAEILAIQSACYALNSQMLYDCDIYVTLEPCIMCAAAISMARIRAVYFGAYDVKSGGISNSQSIFNHANCHYKPQWYGGIKEQISEKLLKDFFIVKRKP